jgi:crotonobetainyl-CoA:carnitine CoA-transferase CaiB-like acyl-CoA transferase
VNKQQSVFPLFSAAQTDTERREGMGALDGYKILDFTTLLPGPYATMTLADLGAEVLKVSGRDKYDLVVNWPPVIEGAQVTGAQAWLGRNKKTMFLNLKKPAAVEAVKKLVMEYDIVVEQFRPGVMNKLGVGYEQLSAVNPRLIYCAITGYGQTGPFAMKAGHDINYLSRSGIAWAAGRKSGGPGLYNFQIADVAGGSMTAVSSILAAIIYREHTGKGQFIDVSMQDSVVPFNSMDGASYFAGSAMPMRESGLLNGGGIYDFYETSDGKYMSVGSLEPKFFAALCIGMGHPEWKDGKILKTDAAMVKETFRQVFRTKTRDEWTAVFSELDACVEPVMDLSEVSQDPHLVGRGMWPSVEVPLSGSQKPGETESRGRNPEASPSSPADADPAGLPSDRVRITQMGCPMHLSACPPRYDHAGYPEGYHTEEILQSLGYTPQEIREMT